MNDGEIRSATLTEGEEVAVAPEEELEEARSSLLIKSSFRTYQVDGETLFIDLQQVASFGGIDSGRGVQVFMKSGDDWAIFGYPLSQFVYDMVSANGLDLAP